MQTQTTTTTRTTTTARRTPASATLAKMKREAKRLAAKLAKMPDPGDVAAPNERAKVDARRRELDARRHRLTFNAQRAEAAMSKAAPIAAKVATIEGVEAKLVEQLAEARDALAELDRAHVNRYNRRPAENKAAEAEAALDLLRRGFGYVHGSPTPPPALAAALPGEVWGEYRGLDWYRDNLRSLEDKIARCLRA